MESTETMAMVRDARKLELILSTEEERDRGTDIIPQVVNVIGEKGSLWAYLTAPAVPRYVENDVPLNENAQKIFSQVYQNTWPIAQPVCSVGVFYFGGSRVPDHQTSPVGIGGYGVVDLNSSEGVSVGTLAEIGGSARGWGVSFGKERTWNLYSGRVHEARLGFLETPRGTLVLDVDTPAIGVLAGDRRGGGAYVVPSFIKGCH